MAAGSENRRRLPAWMLGVAANGQMKKSDDGGENNDVKERGTVSSSVPVESERKRKGKRKSREQNLEIDGSECEIVEEKKEQISISGPTPLKKHKQKKAGVRSIINAEIRLPSDHDVDLTSEDLVIIAKEYVKADADTTEQRSSERDCESIKQLAKIDTSVNESEGSFTAHKYKLEPAASQETASCDSSAPLTSEQNLVSTSRTGDPAQDMLDVFLGPLLKKIPQREKKTEFDTNSSNFSYEFKSSRQNDVGRETLSPVKRKSSLRDKVAMLLE